MTICPHCRNQIAPNLVSCPVCLEPLANRAMPAGAEDIKAAPPPPTLPPAEGLGVPEYARVLPPYVAWEDRQLNIFSRWWRTWAGALFQFDDFWRRVPMDAGSRAPLTYVLFFLLQYTNLNLICGTPLVALVWILAQRMGPGFIMAALPPDLPLLIALYLAAHVVLFLVLLLLLTPAYHLFAKLFRGRGSFDATFRATGYSWGAMLWMLLPYVGPLLALVFHVVAACHGLACAHRFGKGRAAAAILIPLGLLFGGLVGLGLLL